MLNLKSKYKKPAKTGLINIEDNSYLNAVLQCFGNIYNIANYFLDQNNADKINNNMANNINPLSFVIDRLFLHFYPYPEKAEREKYSPENIFKILSTMSTFGSSRNIPSNFLVFLLDELHQELNENKGNKSIVINKSNQPEIIIKEGIKNFKYTNNSIISNNFNWFGLKELYCTQCNNPEYKFETFNTFDLNISEYYQNNKKDDIKINDCLEYRKIQNTLKKQCDNCKNTCNYKVINRIYSSPNIFAFILDREDLNEDLMKIPFIIEEYINLDNYIEDEKSIKEYSLIGVVSISLRERKYIGFSKSIIDNKWYLYNDTKVNEISIDFILKSHNQYNYYIPCILFYESFNGN
jgi:ubiquitin C-terminal hydrolase